MRIAKIAAVVGIAGAVAAGLSGCEKSRDEMRPDMDKVQSDEKGLQARDLREMTNKMAPDLLSIDEIARSPYRVTVVMKSIDNKTEDMQGRNLDIYVARLVGLLNSAQSRDRILFVENRATLEKLQSEELGGGPNKDTFEDSSRTDAPPPQDPRIKPQFALYGTFYSMNNGKTSYYLCQFKMTSLTTGAQVWTGQYEVSTLN
ncbi:MAG TPA: hypothetical protein VM008_12900 [Phycisphaerae bacterium]|nr:hypothetical protein [Phycisphaerae bacterium]